MRIGPRDAREQRATREQIDPDRLLPGEDPATPHPDDASHWIDVYRELIDFKERVVNTAREAVAEAWEKAVSRELASTDLVALEAELARFKRRLEFWHQRREQLEHK